MMDLSLEYYGSGGFITTKDTCHKLGVDKKLVRESVFLYVLYILMISYNFCISYT